MKLTYYKYFLEHNRNRYRINLKQFISNFSQIESLEFRNSFTASGDDNLFLFNISRDMYLFVITKDDEIIKTINSNEMSHEDIHEKLTADERLGFASYVYFSNNYYAIASTFYGPKNTYWCDFINDIFQRVGIDNYVFSSSPFPTSSTRDEALQMQFKGATYLELNNQSSVFQDLCNMFGRDYDANSICITFKPQARQSMDNTFSDIVHNLGDEGLVKYMVKGKRSLDDALTDFYIVGNGHISDHIRERDETRIYSAIQTKIERNEELASKIREFTTDTAYIQNDITNITNFDNMDHWNSYI